MGKAICFSWTAVGWCLGIVVRHNTETDRRRKINGKVINHVVHYEIDDEEAALIRVIFSSDMELSRKLHLTQYVQLIGRISNAMENASDELMYAALKSRI